MKRWLYVVQQRLAITNSEATALLTIGFLLVAGLVVGEVRGRMVRFNDETYALSDRLVREGALAAAQGFETARSDSSGAPDTTALPEKPVAPKRRAGPLMVDLNSASEAELEQLPRIGPALAARIVAYRQENGPFRALDDLMSVKGIGKATFAQLLPHLRIAGGEAEAAADTTR